MRATVLDEIVASTRKQLGRADVAALRSDAREAASQKAPHTFAAALTAPVDAERARIIAEVKSASPSAGSIVESPDVEGIVAEYRKGGAAAISVVTEPQFFRGSRDWLRHARSAGLPVIMKDFIVEAEQLYAGIAAGADAILLLASLLEAPQIRDFIALLDEHGCDALVEVHDEMELERAVGGGAKIIGVNNRDLRDFRVDLGTSERLSALMPQGTTRVAESGIRTRADIDRLLAANFNAFLVGESLLRQHDRAAAVQALASGALPLTQH